MTLETFFEKFDQFADAPDAVEKMRELILESAIRGKLVPHNASAEPASELLKRIASAQAGPVRKQAALPPVGEDAYLLIPPGWEWTRLGNTGRIFNGDSVSESGKAELAKVEDGLPFIATKDVGYGRAALVYDNGLKVPLRDPRFKVARANAVLICAEGGSAGRKIGVTDRDICFGNKLYANEVWQGIHHRYVFYVYQAPTFFKEFVARMTGIIGGIARSEFLSLPFPLPPLAEQERIVAKVDELMALCDRLEAQQQERETRHAALARASLARFADAPTPANLPFLFHPSYAIPPADLRKSILTLAVQGKLVPQDPNDEPAQGLLARIRSEKKRLAARKVIGRDKEWPLNEELQPTFELPASWVFSTLAEIGLINPRNDADDDLDASFVPMKLISAELREPHGHEIRKWAEIKTGFTHFAEGDVSLAKITPCFENGKSAVMRNLASGIGSGTTELHVVRPMFVEADYILIFLKSWLFVKAGIPKMTGTAGQKRVPTSYFAASPFPLPPLAEQRRIVAKVEQLMALVGALETQLTASRTIGADLMEAVVAELTVA